MNTLQISSDFIPLDIVLRLLFAIFIHKLNLVIFGAFLIKLNR